MPRKPAKSTKLRCQRTPTLEQLEARLTFSIDALSDTLAGLLESEQLPALSATAAPKNQAPAVVKTARSSDTKLITSDRTQLSVLGKDDQGEGRLTYGWQLVTGPAGASVSFSSNNSNAAKQTTALFNKPGAYTLSVTMTDQGGLKTTASYKFKVVQSLTQISLLDQRQTALTPGAKLSIESTHNTLYAVGRDQFKNAMPLPSSLFWTATSPTAGAKATIQKSGHAVTVSYNKAADYQLKASSGKLSTTLQVSVAPTTGKDSSFQNPALAGLIKTYFADGSITRPDMIKILRSAGIDGRIDTTELNDLRSLVSQAAKYKIPDDVRVLAGDVVNANPANALYQGRPAGNLAAGASAAELNLLIDKWFYGTDRPTLTHSGFSYQVASGSLFGGSPGLTDQKQGAVGDCYFISALGIIASKTPDAIRNMFIDNQDGTFTVRFFSGTYGSFANTDGSFSDGFRSGTAMADYVTVDRWLPTQAGRFVYQNYGAMLNSSTNTLWLALAEKAYAQWNATGKSGRSVAANSYRAIEGGWMSTVNAQVLGYNSNTYALASTRQQTLLDALNAGKGVTIGTRPGASAGGLVGLHAYSITGYNSQTQLFQLHNPWGSHHPPGLTYSQLQSNCSYFIVADLSPATRAAKGVATPRVASAGENMETDVQLRLAEFQAHTRQRDALTVDQQARDHLAALVAHDGVDEASYQPTAALGSEGWSDVAEQPEAVRAVEEGLETLDHLFGLLAEDDAVFA